MTKWISYLAVLLTLIVTTILSISGTKAGFLMVEDVSLPYKKCTVAEKFSETRYHSVPIKPFAVTKEKLPQNLKWEDGSDLKPFADPKAKRGGTFNNFIMTFPQTFRQVGPNSNSSFRSELDAHDLSLVEYHPITARPYPALAKAWAVGEDKRTVYYKLDPEARWSDGVPITADDYVFMLKFLRSKGLAAPWYNEYYSKQIEDVIKFDDYTIAIRLPHAKPNIVFACGLPPKPYHFFGNFRLKEFELSPSETYMVKKRDHLEIPQELLVFKTREELQKKLDKCKDAAEKARLEAKLEPVKAEIKKINDTKKKYKVTLEDVCESWNKIYNWKVRPNTGAYQLVKYMHGKWVIFKRNENWWANDKKFFKYRYNPDFLKLRLVAKYDIAFEYFKQHELDTFSLSLPHMWYKKSADLDIYEKGYIQKSWLWNNVPRPSRLLSVNLEKESLKDKNIRLGLAHALNFRKMIDLGMLGDAQQADTISTGYAKFTNLDIKARKFDLQKASDYFQKAGYTKFGSDGIRMKDDKRLSFELLYTSPLDKDKLLILKDEARKAGVELELRTFDTNTVFSQMLDKKHELAWHAWSARSLLFGPNYWGQYHGDNAGKPQNNNFTNLNNEGLNKLINLYRNSIVQSEREELSVKIQQIIHDECCAIPTYYIPFIRTAKWRWIKISEFAETPNCTSIFAYGTYWIDTKEREETLKAIKKGKTFPKEFKVYDKYKPNGI